MPLIETRGAASAQGFGEFAQSAAVNYIEDVFSTYLYTGTGSSQTITNGIDLSTKGGLVWCKGRSNPYDNYLFDTNRGVNNYLVSNGTGAQNPYGTYSNLLTAFNSTGFSLGADSLGSINVNAVTYASWTFRKQKKFFDVVTYTGTGVARTIAHSLGSVPGCIIIKRTDASSTLWYVYHRANTSGGSAQSQELRLNNTNATNTNTDVWNNTAPTSTVFSIGAGASPYDWNASGGSYVAYLFAHDAGGFGLSGSDNVISCGSYTGTGAANGQLINLGYEAQWVMIKQTNASGSGWWMTDTMRGWTANGSSGGDANLYANASSAESSQVLGEPDAQGFRPINDNVNQSGQTYIYIAIRRGPMKVPTSGTSVFSPNAFTTNNVKQTTGFPVDMLMGGYRAAGSNWASTVSRLQGLNTTTTSGSPYPRLVTSSTGAELSGTNVYYGYDNTGFISGGLTGSADNIAWSFRRAPGFFDVVCFSGAYAATSYNHNLTVAPEMIIFKKRTGVSDWPVYHVGISTPLVNNPSLNLTGGYYVNNWFPSSPTATTFSTQYLDSGTSNYVAYLFATLAGVSKVGSYTGTGTTKQIDCGFTGGARFVLIKRTDSTGDWYVWDTARGIVSGDDPYLLLNSTAAEVTNTDYVDTYSAGFELSSTAPAALNANGGTYIFLAIA